jgi:predicted ester cyclase
MVLDRDHVLDLARGYTDAWCSGDPARVAAYFVPGGTIAVNGGDPTEVTEVARSFMSTFPDLHLEMDDVVVKGDLVEFHWTCTGTNTGPGGTGAGVRFSGYEEWTFGEDGLVAESQGHFDQADYERQLAHG